MKNEKTMAEMLSNSSASIDMKNGDDTVCMELDIYDGNKSSRLAKLHENSNNTKNLIDRVLLCVTSLTGKKEKAEELCPYRSKVSKKSRSISIDCSECERDSGFEDEKCRKNIFTILGKEPVAERLTLSKLYERDYEGRSLALIYLMAGLKDKLIPYKSTKIASQSCANSEKCMKEHSAIIETILEASETDPLKACYVISKNIEYNNSKETLSDTNPECSLCRDKFASMLLEMSSISGKITKTIAPEKTGSIAEYDNPDELVTDYEKHLKSYVRPPFSTSRIYTEPPDNTLFLECYDISYQDERHLPVNIYQLTDRPEKMYIINPVEYSLEEKELKLVERVRKKMIMHRPADLHFADPANSREYFRKLSKQLLLDEQDVDDIISDPAKVKLCCDLLTKYTTGLGILEDLMSDERVTDIYVNAPADLNPVHVVLDGEECVTNVYLSQEDMESMVSRLRSISGRPFGEATPVLEMFLREYGVRVSVIGDPLSAKGIAYAFRKHAKDPWSLPKLINNGSISPLTAGLLSFIMDGQASVLVAGGVGAGKTSLMCAMLLEIPQKYRMITIEDTSEIPVEELQEMGWKVQGLNSQSAIMKYGVEIEPSVALRASLRLGSSSLIMGEVRGPEVAVLYEAMQVGAAGNSVVGTIHGSSTERFTKE